MNNNWEEELLKHLSVMRLEQSFIGIVEAPASSPDLELIDCCLYYNLDDKTYLFSGCGDTSENFCEIVEVVSDSTKKRFEQFLDSCGGNPKPIKKPIGIDLDGFCFEQFLE